MKTKLGLIELFAHGWTHYLNHAFPEDELDPLECKGRGSDKLNPGNININDVLGDFALTMVDTLDTIALMGTQQEFEDTVKQVIESVSFNHNNNRVQVFETNIRVLGGLLSAHLLATDPTFNHTIPTYQGELLTLAKDLADRLLDAFNNSSTGIPFPRVNLKRGVLPTETTETCTAGAGSLILEFGVLSRLSGDYTYETVAKRALQAVWDRRSSIDLMGNVIDLQTGQWIHIASSTGAGIDSIFEYMLKAFVLFGEEEYKIMFEKAYQAILLHVRDPSAYLYRNVHMGTGELMSHWIDSLGAFFPGLQVLYGDLDAAIKGHLVYFNIWRKYGALPERFNFFQKRVELPNYPLRPEFIESTYYLYQATKDPFYLEVGEMIVEDLNRRTRVPCGFAAMADVRTGQLEGRMESFMLSESLKYLYLLFDADHPINRLDSNFVFTTEGHILPLPKAYLNTQQKSSLLRNEQQKKSISLRYIEDNKCPNYQTKRYISRPGDIDGTSIPYQPQTDYASEIVGHNTSAVLAIIQNGYCEPPALPKKVSLSFGPYFGFGKNDQ
ncbi:glycoside hydrolase family 47 protein, partial [Backusella circina FSU 941]